MYFISTLFLFIIALLSLAESSSPAEFMESINGYRSACKKLGWEPKQDCTASNVIAFHASLKSNLNNIPVNTTIKFETVKLNKGGGYDSETGIFTAPEDGVYSFGWSYLSKQGATVYVAATVDNVDHAHTCTNNQQTGYMNTYGSLLFELKKGNKVWMRVWHVPATFIHGGFYSYFSGSRINF